MDKTLTEVSLNEEQLQEILEAVQSAVCSGIRNPESVTIPQNLITVFQGENGGYRVTGYVNSLNGFNVTVRNSFVADVIYEDDVPVATATIEKASFSDNWMVMGFTYLIVFLFAAGICGAAFFLIKLLMG